MKIHISGFDARTCDAEVVKITRALKSTGHELAGPTPLPVQRGLHRRVLGVKATAHTANCLTKLQLAKSVLAEIGIG